jgi:hypothetical protein
MIGRRGLVKVSVHAEFPNHSGETANAMAQAYLSLLRPAAVVGRTQVAPPLGYQ